MNAEKRPILWKKRPLNELSYESTSSTNVHIETQRSIQNDELSKLRNLNHPTTNFDTLIHLLKGNIGTGILAMPMAFKYAGLYVGLAGIMGMGFICTHCMHILVKCSHELCWRMKIPSMNFPDVSYHALSTGPFVWRKYALLLRRTINLFLCITQLGGCSVYFVFVSINLKEVIDHYFVTLDTRIYLFLLFIPMILLNFLKNLKYLAPISLFASILTATGLAITFVYTLQDLPNTSIVPKISSWDLLPIYFGSAIFAFEGIGVLLPLENNMKTPQDFSGLTGVLNTGMVIVTCLYAAVGFFGYLKYNECVHDSITTNLGTNDVLAQSVCLMMALAIFLTYSLQFYVPINIIGPWFQQFFEREHYSTADAILRISLVSFTFLVAFLVPHLGKIISLVGAASSSTLALIFPPLIEIITFYPNRLGHCNWVLWKDIAIILLGVFGFIFGSYASILALMSPDEEISDECRW